MWKEQVDRGVAYLDRVEPNWREKVNPEILVIDSMDNCVLGQVFGHFDECQLVAGDDWVKVALHYGFYEGITATDEEMLELEREWISRL